ncbi:MAG: methyltransferase domain-containing protein [Pseudomonadota bacterium]
MAEDILARAAGFDRHWRRCLDLGAHDGRLARRLRADTVLTCDCTSAFRPDIVAEEDRLPFANAAFDLIVSAGSLDTVNDLPGALVQLRRALVPGGVLLASFVGGASFAALRSQLSGAVVAATGTAQPLLHPMIDAREAPALLQRAGFAEPVVDVHQTVVRYRDVAAMLRDVRSMGASNILDLRSRRPLTRVVYGALLSAMETLRDLEHRIPVDVELITLTGKAPA